MQCPGHLLRYRLNTSEAATINKSLIPHLSVPAVPPYSPHLLSHSLPRRNPQAIVLMSSTTHTPQSNFQLIIDALANYANQTGIDLSNNPFADKLQLSNSPDAIIELLHDREKAFREYRDENRKLINCLTPAVQVLHAFSRILGESVSPVRRTALGPLHCFHAASAGPFPPSKSGLCWY